MIWLVLRVIVFLVLIVAIAIVGGYLVDSDGSIAITWRGVEYPPISHVEFIAAVLALAAAVFLVYKIVGLAFAVIRFLLGDETALSRFWSRAKERRGVEALEQGMVALAEGDFRTADVGVRKASRMLGKRDAVRILAAQIAEARGDVTAAKREYRALAKEPETAIVGVKGLLAQAARQGETERAMKLADHAFSIRPRDPEIQKTLFDLQVKSEHWTGAKGTINAMLRAKTLPKEVAARRNAVIDVEIARAEEAAGRLDKAIEAADAAVRAAPSFSPASVTAARLHLADGAKNKAARILREAWRLAPQPELASGYADIEPEESPSERRKRFRDLIGANENDPESRLLAAELAISDHDWSAARRAVGDLASEKPTHRSLAVMAAVEKGEGGDDSVVRGYLARAVTAPRGAHWVCDSCGSAPGSWSAVCPSCGAFDTLGWREETEAKEAFGASMLPLIVETDADKEAEDRLDDEAAEEAVREAADARA